MRFEYRLPKNTYPDTPEGLAEMKRDQEREKLYDYLEYSFLILLMLFSIVVPFLVC